MSTVNCVASSYDVLLHGERWMIMLSLYKNVLRERIVRHYHSDTVVETSTEENQDCDTYVPETSVFFANDAR